MNKIAIFYHCYLINKWYDIVCSQLRKIHNSGLYDKVDFIFCSVLISPYDNSSLKRFEELIKEFPKIRYKLSSFSSFEFYVIKELYDFCVSDLKNEYFVLYINVKGVTRPNNPPDESWRNCLDYFNIEQYEKCIDILNAGKYNICGCQLGYVVPSKDTIQWKYYAGNYWWATSKYIKTLPSPLIVTEYSRRPIYETWILNGNEDSPTSNNKFANPYCLYKSIIDLRGVYLPDELYRNDMKCSFEVKIKHQINNLMQLIELKKNPNHRYGDKNLSEKIADHYADKYPKWILENYDWEDGPF